MKGPRKIPLDPEGRKRYRRDYGRAQYHRRKAGDMCPRCGEEAPAPGRVACAGCLAVLRFHWTPRKQRSSSPGAAGADNDNNHNGDTDT